MMKKPVRLADVDVREHRTGWYDSERVGEKE